MNKPLVYMKIGSSLFNIDYVVGVEERRTIIGNKVECDGSDVYLVDGRSVYYPGTIDEFVKEVLEMGERGE